MDRRGERVPGLSERGFSLCPMCKNDFILLTNVEFSRGSLLRSVSSFVCTSFSDRTPHPCLTTWFLLAGPYWSFVVVGHRPLVPTGNLEKTWLRTERYNFHHLVLTLWPDYSGLSISIRHFLTLLPVEQFQFVTLSHQNWLSQGRSPFSISSINVGPDFFTSRTVSF